MKNWTTISLPKGELLNLRRKTDRIQCLSGDLWITGKNSEDILLKKGECLCLKGLKKVYAEAMTDSRLLLNACPSQTLHQKISSNCRPDDITKVS